MQYNAKASESYENFSLQDAQLSTAQQHTKPTAEDNMNMQRNPSYSAVSKDDMIMQRNPSYSAVSQKQKIMQTWKMTYTSMSSNPYMCVCVCRTTYVTKSYY